MVSEKSYIIIFNNNFHIRKLRLYCPYASQLVRVITLDDGKQNEGSFLFTDYSNTLIRTFNILNQEAQADSVGAPMNK